jgi:23S rRNA (cytidine1920-2'-O)/16S rRNA (cytidine1409-2'-O)-methyltransferase
MAAMAAKRRLDQCLVEQGLAESRSIAQRLIMAGLVRVGGQLGWKAAQLVDPGTPISVIERPRYVSRGGEKLEAALQSFAIHVDGGVCADVGASTGGFTDCLLQHGARRVYAIDVGKGILHWKLRSHPGVVVMEGTNARHVHSLPESIDLVTIDAAFISLRLLLPVVRGWLGEGGEVVALIKPQFEAGRGEVSRGGVVRKPAVHRRVVEELLVFARQIDLQPLALIRSPIIGPKGNIEFLSHLAPGLPGRELKSLTDPLFEEE